MKEIDVRVADSDLAVEWYKQGVFTLDNLIDSIEINNLIYGFNLYDNGEELETEPMQNKMAIKYKTICVPMVEATEEVLKSILIAYRHLTNPSQFNRATVVYDIMRDVRNEARASGQNVNGHDFFGLINYINNNVDPMFITRIANEYATIRDGDPFFNNQLSLRSTVRFATSEERIRAATSEYTQGFIEFRYLFENDEAYSKNVDLTKLSQYCLAIHEVAGQLLHNFGMISDMDMPDVLIKHSGKKKISHIISEKADEKASELVVKERARTDYIVSEIESLLALEGISLQALRDKYAPKEAKHDMQWVREEFLKLSNSEGSDGYLPAPDAEAEIGKQTLWVDADDSLPKEGSAEWLERRMDEMLNEPDEDIQEKDSSLNVSKK